MVKLAIAVVVTTVVFTMLGWIDALNSVANNAYDRIYGKPMEHPDGGTVDHLNAWLNFLPNDSLTRGAIVGSFIAGLLILTFILNMLRMRYGRYMLDRRLDAESKARAISSYHKAS